MADADSELLPLLLAGDEAAFCEVVERYHRRLVRFAATFVHDRGAAEDVAQETWLAVLRGIEKFEGRSSLQTWLFGICANRARTAYTRDARVVPVDDIEPTVDPARFDALGSWATPPELWSDVDSRLDAEALVPVVRAAIEALPDQQRQVVTLRDVEGLTSKDVCMVLAITEINQRVLLHRGRARVRRAVEEKVQGKPQ
jgi:RNA polymerase sigma-70 factor, ECF subfamily